MLFLLEFTDRLDRWTKMFAIGSGLTNSSAITVVGNSTSHRSYSSAMDGHGFHGRTWLCRIAGLLSLYLVLVLLKSGSLYNPPYNEFAESFWTEVVYFAETNFDYNRLLYETQLEEGGIRTYIISLIGIPAALLLRSMDTADAIFIFHLIEIACAAFIICWTFEYLRHDYGFQRAFAVTLAVFSMPFFSAHLEMLGMEFPTTLVSLLAIQCYQSRRLALGLIAVLFAFFMKPSTAPLTLSFALCLSAEMFFRSPIYRKDPWRVYEALAATIIVGMAQFTIIRIIGANSQFMHREFYLGPLITLIMWIFVAPSFLFVISYCVICEWRWWITHRAVRKGSNPTRVSFRRRLILPIKVAVRERPGNFMAFVYLAVAFSIMFLVMVAARYLIALMPMLAILLGDVLFRRTKSQWFAPALISSVIVYNFASAFGNFMLPLTIISNDRAFAIPERSLGYRSDLESEIRACRIIDALPPDEPILAAKIMTHLTSSPYFGFVKADRKGYTVLDNFTIGRMRPAIEIIEDRPESIVVVGSANGDFIFPPPDADDEILYDDKLEPPLIIYRKRFGENADRSKYEAFYRKMLELNSEPYIRFSVATVHKLGDLSAEYYERRFGVLDVSPDLLDWLGTNLEELGDPVAAKAAHDEAAWRREHGKRVKQPLF